MQKSRIRHHNGIRSPQAFYDVYTRIFTHTEFMETMYVRSRNAQLRFSVLSNAKTKSIAYFFSGEGESKKVNRARNPLPTISFTVQKR